MRAGLGSWAGASPRTRGRGGVGSSRCSSDPPVLAQCRGRPGEVGWKLAGSAPTARAPQPPPSKVRPGPGGLVTRLAQSSISAAFISAWEPVTSFRWGERTPGEARVPCASHMSLPPPRHPVTPNASRAPPACRGLGEPRPVSRGVGHGHSSGTGKGRATVTARGGPTRAGAHFWFPSCSSATNGPTPQL